LESVTVRLGWLAVVQGLTATAIACKGRELFWIFSAISVFSVVFGLITVARKELWIASLIACGLIAFIAFFALFDTPLLIVCVALGLLEWRLLAKYTPLERETWLLRKASQVER
jgi:energy-converting hydrogenase Eha subunit H